METETELEKAFYDRYISKKYIFSYKEDGVGIKDIKAFPDTELHRELFPELYDFTIFGFDCSIKRSSMSHDWCGYVKLYSTHPYFSLQKRNFEGKNIDGFLKDRIVEEIQVHGGIAYDNNISYVIGFDTAHFGDLNPFNSHNSHSDTFSYKDRNYVIKELEFLSLQLYLMLPIWSFKTHKQFPDHLRIRFWNIYKQWKLMKTTLKEKFLWIEIISQTFELEKLDAYLNHYKKFK
jgi:hypothetical protein